MTAIDDWISELQKFRGSANFAPLISKYDTVIAALQAMLPQAASIYTPTLTNGGNVQASTSHVATYQRVGSIVNVAGTVDIDPTAGAASTTLRISLPVASVIGSGNLCGMALRDTGIPILHGIIIADVIAGQMVAELDFLNDARVGNDKWTYNFMYEIT